MMSRMHANVLPRAWYRAAAAGAAVLAASTAAISTASAQTLVQGVRVESSTAGTVVAVTLTDSVARSAFTLAGPNRIVLDLPGTTLGALGARAYDGQARGPVQNVRMAQYRPDIVRVVIDVDGTAKYALSGGNEVRIAMAGGTDVAAWSTGDALPSRRAEQVATAVNTAVAVMDSTVSSARVAAGESESRVAYQTPESNVIGGGKAAPGKAPKPRITVSYQDADIRDVIAAFASFANRTIIVGKDVTGSITADVKDKPWDEALAAILTAQGLAASEEPNGIIIVDSYKNMLDKQSLEPLITQVVSINYANASSVAGTVRGLLTRDCVPGAGSPSVGGAGGVPAPGAIPAGCTVRGSVQADSATNSLLIREVQSRMEDVISYVRSIDRRTPQVAIKAKIIFVNRTSLQEMGILYDIGTARQYFNTVIPRQEVVQQIPIDRNGDGVPDAFREVLQPVIGDRVDFGGNSLSALANANASISNPALNLIFSAAMGKYSLTPFIQALQEATLADVQAEPTVVTLDNRRAEILVGQEIPIRVLDAGAGAAGVAGQINIPRATVQLKEVGISLQVTPRITNNRQIMMTIAAENSSAQLASSDVGFIFNKQRANNTLMVPDGETAVIGGLTITQVTRSRRGVPYLMNIPFLGRLFATTRKDEQKRDLVILVSPHILDDGDARTSPPNPGR
jgi:type IV pilus assembly protein PilQ